MFDLLLERKAVVDGDDARLAAAKGLIAAGVENGRTDVNAITRAMRERGVVQRGEATTLIRGDMKTENGRDKIGITTALHRDEEHRLVANANAAGADRSAALTKRQIAAAVAKHPELDFRTEHGQVQRAVMEQLGTEGRLSVAIGAGADFPGGSLPEWWHNAGPLRHLPDPYSTPIHLSGCWRP